MSKEIIILEKAPIVFTKNKDWGDGIVMEPGAIILLPDDAVLVITPTEEANHE